MRPATFDKILWLPDTGMVRWWQANKGTIEVSDGSLTFRGSKRPLTISKVASVTRVHSGAWANDLLRVDYADGDHVASAYFAIAIRGEAGKEVIDKLYAQIASATSQTALPPTALEAHQESLRQAIQATNTSAERTITVGVVLLVGGLLVTFVSLAIAQAGGTYVIAYGAILGGIALIFQGLAKRSKETRDTPSGKRGQ